MGENRTKNAMRNIFFGIILKCYQILIPFLMRTAMIYFMGVQYLGLNSLFTSILQVLNMAELGVGVAMVYSMYEPIAVHDTKKICELLKLYKSYYRVIGVIIAFIGLILTPFIPKLISGTIPSGINIYILYILNLSATVISYWLYAYKSSLLQAHQRADVSSKVTLITSTFQYSLQILVLWKFRNYYFYVIVMLITQAITNVLTAAVASKLYPDYHPIGTLPRKEKNSINRKIRDLFTSKIGGVILDSADTIVISAFLGLTTLAIYQNYFFVMNSITAFIMVIFNSLTAGVGNSILLETKEKNYDDLLKLTFIICWITGFCTCCFAVMYQPFMEIWVGKELMMSTSVVYCLCVYFYLQGINRLLNMYKDAAGIWHKDRWRPLVVAITNLLLNLVMVQFCAIYGVVLSTVLATLFVGMPWLVNNLFSTLFEKNKLYSYIKNVFYYTCISFLAVVFTIFISKCICERFCFNAIRSMLCGIIICLIIPNTFFLYVYRKRKEFDYAKQILVKITKKIIR